MGLLAARHRTGSRAALLGGTPASVLAHDSRTLELARYFATPHRLLRDAREDLDVAGLYREADLAPLHAGHADRLATFIGFLERAGLDHVFAHEGAAAAFDRRIAATPFPGAVTSSTPVPVVPGPASAARRIRSHARRLAVSQPSARACARCSADENDPTPTSRRGSAWPRSTRRPPAR